MIKYHDVTWIEFWKSFHSSSKNRDAKSEGVAGVLSRNYTLFAIEDVCSLGFEAQEEYHGDDGGFCELFRKYVDVVQGEFLVHDGFLRHGNRLCVPKHVRKLLMKEAHGCGLAGHVGIMKPLEMLKGHFF